MGAAASPTGAAAGCGRRRGLFTTADCETVAAGYHAFDGLAALGVPFEGRVIHALLVLESDRFLALGRWDRFVYVSGHVGNLSRVRQGSSRRIRSASFSWPVAAALELLRPRK